MSRGYIITGADSEAKRVVLGTIGHVDHGKTTLTAAITKVLLEQDTLQETPEIIAQLPFNDSILGQEFKSGREKRRERRKKERKNK